MAETVSELKSLLERRTRELEGCESRLRNLARANGAAEMSLVIEQRFHSVFRNSAAGMALLFPDGRFIEVNLAFCRFLGYAVDELLKLTVDEITHPDDREETRRLRGKASAGETRSFDLEKRYLHKDGATLWGHVSANWFYDDADKPVYSVAIIQDITARKEAEEALRRSEERFRSIFQNTSSGMVMITPDGSFLDANPSFCEFLGYSREELLRLSVADITHPDDLENTRLRLDEVRGGRHRTFNGGKRYLRKDGATVWGEGTANWFFESDGTPSHGVAIIQDITERKSAEEALRDSEKKFAKAFHATPTWLVISTLDDGRLIEINEAFERICGYRRDEVIGRTALEIGLWETPTDRAAVVETLRSGGAIRDREARFKGKDGKVFTGLFSAELIDINGSPCLLSLVNDVTERKRSEEALRESEEHLRRAIAEAPFPVMIHTEDGYILHLSKVWCELSGYSREELRTVADWTERAYRDRRETVEAELAKVYSLHERQRAGEYVVTTATGEELLWDFSTAPLGRLPDGRHLVLSMAVDMTPHKRMQEMIEILNTDLASKAIELEAANRELEAFNYTVSHDLRSPLTGIAGYCQILQEFCTNRLDEQCSGYIREIDRSAQCMERLITTLLNFSRLSRAAISGETVDLSGMAEALLGELRASEPHRQVACTVAHGVLARGDAKLLKVVMENLLGNAWKYTGKRETARIEFGVTEERGERVFFVRDNGAGFDMQERDKLFAPFQRLHGDEEFAGHGIGLATVQRIVQRHGGRVWAEGSPGEGATFYFTLPLP